MSIIRWIIEQIRKYHTRREARYGMVRYLATEYGIHADVDNAEAMLQSLQKTPPTR